jgi:hypothetical protein
MYYNVIQEECYGCTHAQIRRPIRAKTPATLGRDGTPQELFYKKALALYLDEYQDYETALARRADKDEEVLTLTQMKKALGV